MIGVVTLAADPARAELDGAILQRAVQALPLPEKIEWLDRGVAADIFIECPDARMVGAQVRGALAAAPIDFFVQSAAGRRKRLLVADMDSTMIAQECVDELADFVGLKAHVAAITERAMRGEIAFEPALRERVALLKDLDAAVIDKIIAERISLMPGARTLVQTMRANGAYTVLVSGGFTLFTQAIAARIGFHEHQGNRLVVIDGKLAGRIEEPVLGQAAKREALEGFCATLGISSAETLAVGDGANDLAMLESAGLSVAFRAKPAVSAAAQARVDHCDVTALLYAQGYKRDEFMD